MNEPQPEKASADSRRLAELFLKTHGNAIDQEIQFLEKLTSSRSEDGALQPDLGEQSAAAKMKRMVVAIREVACFGVIDADAMKAGIGLFGLSSHKAMEAAQHDQALARRAEKVVRKKLDKPEYLPLSRKQQGKVEQFRSERLEFSRDMSELSDGMREIQGSLMDLLRSMNISTRVSKPVQDQAPQSGRE